MKRLNSYQASSTRTLRIISPEYRVISKICSEPDTDLLICLSHLRWNFVYQRPQHLMSRFARAFTTVFLEEPLIEAVEEPRLDLRCDPSGITIAVPILPERNDEAQRTAAQRQLLDGLVAAHGSKRLSLWYYTPMALLFSRHLRSRLCVYDCMDELTGFRFAPPALRQTEDELFARADLVFTGGQSLYEAKRRRHPSVHAFPSSVDVDHFRRGRLRLPEPPDQAPLPRPRLGFFGVVDERMDLDLVRGVAAARPDWQLVMVGPVVKIDPASLPRGPNIHWLGGKSYAELPDYLAGWDVALMPFALNEATRFISPTKTLEYLAAAKPVVSTSILDVVQPYGEGNLVAITEGAHGFVAAAERLLGRGDPPDWLARVDDHLGGLSWNRTWEGMIALMQEALDHRPAGRTQSHAANLVNSAFAGRGGAQGSDHV